MFDRCIKNEMAENMRKDVKEIREEIMELGKDVTECKTDIADNKQNIADHRNEIHNINTRNIPPNIRSKLCCLLSLINTTGRGRCGCDRMVVGFTTIYAISVNHH
jgi:septal ring factor EnvC (AmiA/AmiB activator)